MAIWLIGLKSRRGAERAANWGSIACLLQATRMAIGNIVAVVNADKELGSAIAWSVGANLIPLLFVIGGIRLWRGKDWLAAAISAIVMILEFVAYNTTPTSISSTTDVVVRLVIVILIINGVRGALALQRGDLS